MHPASLTALAALALFVPSNEDPQALVVPYETGLTLELDASFHYESEVVDFTLIRDGVEQDMSGRMGGPSSVTRKLLMSDHYTKVEEGRPLALERSFETLSHESKRMRGDEEMVTESSGPLESVTLGLTLEDGEVAVEVLKGSAPDDDALLEGFSMTLGLDGLLPEGKVEPGATWHLAGEALVRALGLDLEGQLFPPPPRSQAPEGGGPGRRGGGMRGGGGNPVGAMIRDAEWDFEATLAEEHADVDGTDCLVIELEGDGEYELPERPAFGGGGGRGGDRFVPESSLALPPFGGGAGLELEGKLYLDSKTHLPVRFEVEMEVSIDEVVERSSERGDTTMHTATEGTLTYVANLRKVVADE